jgi:DUF3102 family protein
MTRPNRTLPQIAREIKTLEKRSIKDAITIGKLLHEAEDQCEHGTYMEWLKTEFDFSYSTSLNYRNAYAFSQKHNSCDYGKLNISLGAFYLLAALEAKTTISAIIKAAKNGRVSRSIAQDIVDKLDEPPPITPREPREPPPIEPLDEDEDGDETDDTPIVPDDADDDDDGEPSEDVTTAGLIDTALDFPVCSPVWPKAIKHMGGSVKLRAVIEHLNAVYDRHCDKGAVQSAADRAEAKAVQTARKTQKEESEG